MHSNEHPEDPHGSLMWAKSVCLLSLFCLLAAHDPAQESQGRLTDRKGIWEPINPQCGKNVKALHVSIF